MLKILNAKTFNLTIENTIYCITHKLCETSVIISDEPQTLYSIESEMTSDNYCDKCLSDNFTNDKHFALKVFDSVVAGNVTPLSLCEVIDDAVGLYENSI